MSVQQVDILKKLCFTNGIMVAKERGYCLYFILWQINEYIILWGTQYFKQCPKSLEWTFSEGPPSTCKEVQTSEQPFANISFM